jgi:hypothetical protein
MPRIYLKDLDETSDKLNLLIGSTSSKKQVSGIYILPPPEGWGVNM